MMPSTTPTPQSSHSSNRPSPIMSSSPHNHPAHIPDAPPLTTTLPPSAPSSNINLVDRSLTQHARFNMWSLLMESWTSAPFWTQFSLYVSTLVTLLELALPMSATILAVVQPSSAPSCFPYISLNYFNTFVTSLLALTFPFSVRWELLARQPTNMNNLQFTKLDRSVKFLRSLLGIAHFVIFILVNLQLFRIEPDIQQCPDSPAVFQLTVSWLVLFYIKLFGPIAVLIVGCLCLPILILIARHLNHRHAERMRLANKLPDDVLSQLSNRTYAGGSEENPTASQLVVSSKEDACCAICLEDYVLGDPLLVLPCKHHFHTHCLSDWFQLSKLCPLCKQNLVQLVQGTDGDIELELAHQQHPVSAHAPHDDNDSIAVDAIPSPHTPPTPDAHMK